MQLITETDALAAACTRLSRADFVALDTEFMRETTFWPDLCLVQMAGGEEEVIVDALADGLDLTPFFDLMGDRKVLKVFHAARQDIEIVFHRAGIIPHPVFDTQVAAMVCGFGDSVSYGMLVKRLLKRDLDKTSRFTDWSRRPLTDKQLIYALGDATHLRDLYPKLRDQLQKSGRAHWLDEEMAVLTDPATYETHPQDAWRRLKLRVKSPKALAIMIELADWREREAQEHNVPRRRILKDDAIYDIANQAPRSTDDLSGLRSIHGGFARSARGKAVLEAVDHGLQRDPKALPRIKRGEPLPPEANAVMDLLRVLLKSAAARHGVAPKLIATAEDLEKIARDPDADVPALKGWRRDLFGRDALAIKDGKLALTVQAGAIRAVSTRDLAGQGGKKVKRSGASNGERRDRSSEAPALALDDVAPAKRSDA